ncbi:VanZ family protein [Catellatospora tritici]|uniref:VanZ family protein n=1 Tax=Catellatospora tritici TaxID=2851566 RepID=UPI001C2D0CC9|nr:VanZ family protein [Catellatospora tritici]MBV1851479.1 VanZ family protein [Catellatospora tritici]
MMQQLWQRWHVVWITMVALAPLMLLTIATLTRLRVRGGLDPVQARRRSLAEVLAVAGTIPWVWMIMTPVQVPPDFVRVYLIPLSDLRVQMIQPIGFIVPQIVGNLLVLFALGAGAPVRAAVFATPWRLFALGAACSFVLEVVQHLFVSGRVFSVDDILVNALGCLLGGLATRRWWATAVPERAAALR